MDSRSRDAAALVLPCEPRWDAPPQRPTAGDRAVLREALADFVEGLILIDRTIDLKNDQVMLADVVEVGDGDADPLVLPREPIRHTAPGGPTAGDVAVPIEARADPVHATVGTRRVVDHQHDEF